MNDGNFKIDVRVVGLYAYFRNLTFDQFNERTTIEEIMYKVAERESNFHFDHGNRVGSGNQGISKISYNLTTLPTSPNTIPNASNPTLGLRTLQERLNTDPAAVLQFYREAEISDGTKTLRVRNQTIGQPSFSDTPIGLIDKNGPSLTESLPDGWGITKYRLIWRLVEIDMKAETRERMKIKSIQTV